LKKSDGLRAISKPELSHQNPRITNALATRTKYANPGVSQDGRLGASRVAAAFLVRAAGRLKLNSNLEKFA
jgi:hypothetical protein